MTDSVRLQGNVLDELLIRRQASIFADAAMAADSEAFAATFIEEGVCIFDPPANVHKVGRQEIAELLHTLRQGQDFFVQYAQPGRIQIDDDTATMRTACYEIARGPGDHFYRNHGMFFDQLVRRDGDWLFASRRYSYLLLDTSPFDGTPFQQLDLIARNGAA